MISCNKNYILFFIFSTEIQLNTMDPDSFKDFAKEMTEFITNYLENIRDR